MAYESKIYVVKRKANATGIYGEIIAMYDCCAMGGTRGWTEMFTENVKYDVFIDSNDIPTKEDMYGDELKETSIEKVIEWLEMEIKYLESKNDYYRRLPPLLAMLKGFNLTDWQNGLYIIHYGY